MLHVQRKLVITRFLFDLSPPTGIGICTSAREGNELRVNGKGIFTSELGGLGFPGGTVVENPPANAGDTGLSPGPGKSHMPRSN